MDGTTGGRFQGSFATRGCHHAPVKGSVGPTQDGYTVLDGDSTND